jgi:hypothetical protein
MTLIASCHCGKTRIALPDIPSEGTRCNCTFCQRAGAVWAYYKVGDLKLLQADGQRSYSTNPEYGLHHFCGNCGMHTWGESVDWSSAYNDDGTPKGGDTTLVPERTQCQINLNLIDDLDWSKIKIVELDGRNNW